MEGKDALPSYIEFLALLYHEARNVRQLFRHNAASRSKFGALAEHLPPEPEQSWTRLIHLQQRAADAKSAKEAEAVFVEHFGCSTDDLAKLFDNPGWKRAPGLGGPRWAAIAREVSQLQTLIESSDAKVAAKVDEILALPQNSGNVHAMLARLKAVPR